MPRASTSLADSRLSPSSLTFGLVAMFQTEEMMATIYNDGPVTLPFSGYATP